MCPLPFRPRNVAVQSRLKILESYSNLILFLSKPKTSKSDIVDHRKYDTECGASKVPSIGWSHVLLGTKREKEGGKEGGRDAAAQIGGESG